MDVAGLDPLERAALAHCGTGEAGLQHAARVVVARKLGGLRMPELDALSSAQRIAGEPHPWPRAWVASARQLAEESTMRRLDGWLSEGREPRLRRCGVASGVGADGVRVLAVVAVDALADLAPLPTRVRAGQWLGIEATLCVRARGVTVLVLGPVGAPRTVPTSFDGRRLRAHFAPDQPGEFYVQVVADTAAGPRPILEASVFADVDPPQQPNGRAAPGEDAACPGEDDDALSLMLSAARASVGLPPLVRDRRLDDVARAHALRMVAIHQLAHDAGDGDPIERLRTTGLDARAAGENVAHASSIALVHRAIWASPSHRANMLRRDFDGLGLGIARDEHGDVWVVEMFAGSLR
jgi:uncharacterized protein YkwD